ncbi:hypothetical protein FQN54_008364 [Arachnomyces sp. PD_36]|nr:hypothetical protein FQN54_008364 [Arachnomyces sp. PD_36]
MGKSSLFGSAAAGFANLAHLSVLLQVLCVPVTLAALFTPVTPPELDLSQLGRVALTGNFDAISLYSYVEQSETQTAANGSQSLLTVLPNDALATLASSDADILTMCAFTRKDGDFYGVFVGGNFTSLRGIESQGVALFDPNSNELTPVDGLHGQVLSLLCDQDTDTVYVGGYFDAANSSNAVTWVGDDGWTNLPFAGFNGVVNSIIKKDDGHIVFGGSFSGLGNTTVEGGKEKQVINLSSAEVTGGSTTVTEGFNDPENIVCKANGQDGPGNTWLLSDNQPGYWRATMNFWYQPRKLRLWNTHQDGRGTKTFRFTAIPDNGIMNLTYTDPDSGDTVACDALCSLSDDPAEEYRDFEFVNYVGMNGFQLDISDWYGAGGGLNGIELLEDDIFAYAINDFNEPSCADTTFGSKATTTGEWSVTPSGQSYGDYLSVQASDSSPVSITFQPDIKESGNYSITLYTPGCIQDGTCDTRGIVNVTGTYAADTDPTSVLLYQTNNFDKYDEIYFGYVDASSDSFRPSVELSPQPGQGDIDVVALRVRFQSTSSTGGLNGLFEFDPKAKSIETEDFSDSAINKAGMDLDSRALIKTLAISDGVVYGGGNFSNSSVQNIMAFSDDQAAALPGGGLNANVNSMLVLDDFLYVGGAFSDTSEGGSDDLTNVAAYSISSKSWEALGAGVNGPVDSIVKFPLNITDELEDTVAISGMFDQINAFGNDESARVSGLAIWVPSQKNWLQNLDITQMAFYGRLSAAVSVNDTVLLAGAIGSGGTAASGAVSLADDDGLTLQSFPLNIDPQEPQQSLRKRFVGGQGVTGIVTALFDKSNDRNLTIFGGHFSATSTDGSSVENLLFLDGSNEDAVTGLGEGLDSDSIFVTMVVQDDTLFAGGSVTGSISDSDVNGLITYDLKTSDFAANQPPAFSGSDGVVVNSIATRPDSDQVYVGGQFSSAGSLPCPSVCYYEMSDKQWNRPGTGLQGEVASLMWATDKKLIVAGNLTVGNNDTMLATYDTSSQAWKSTDGASAPNIPGPITAICAGTEDASRLWVAGQSSNGSTFLVHYDGSEYFSVGDIFDDKTVIRGIQILALSEDHDDTDYLENDQLLLITGQLQIPDFGTASAALFNGSDLTPFILSTTAGGQPGSLAALFTENKNTLSGDDGSHSRGIVILISFCLALACVFLIVLIGVILNRIQRRRQGYVRAPQTYGTDRQTSLRRVPPEHLFESLRQRTSGAPAV